MYLTTCHAESKALHIMELFVQASYIYNHSPKLFIVFELTLRVCFPSDDDDEDIRRKYNFLAQARVSGDDDI